MKRDFLTELGIETEQVDKIMAEYGKSVNALKDEKDALEKKASTVDDLTEQLKQRDAQLEELSKKAQGNEELTAQIDELKQKNEQTANDYQDKLDKQAFDFALEKALSQAEAKNPKAVKALLNTEAIKVDGDTLLGLEDQLKALKESDAYLFGDEQPGLRGRQPNLNGNTPPPNKTDFATMTSEERLQLKESDPKLYSELREKYINKF